MTERRAPILCTDLARPLLHEAIAACAAVRPFVLQGLVLLPDHLHMLIRLPDGDADFSMRLAAINAAFTHSYLACGGIEQPRSAARLVKRRRGVWQRWFWEHTISDDADFERHLNYIHYNPVKHGLAACPHGWPHSTFDRWVAGDGYEADWQCVCDGRHPDPLAFEALPIERME